MTTINMTLFIQEVSEKKRYLSGLVAEPIETISRECMTLLEDVEQLDLYLQEAILLLPYCTRLYVTDQDFCQLSSNVASGDIDKNFRHQDLSQRPYLQATIPLKGLILSDIYQDACSEQVCITLVQAIQYNKDLTGFVFADFNFDHLPLPEKVSGLITNWHQFKGDPAIRGSLFSQERIHNQLDKNIHQVHEVIQKLLLNYGVFHFKLHYSSSRITLWFYDKPHHYCLHSVDDLMSEKIFTLYPSSDYPDDGLLDEQKIDIILKQFRELRFIDENVYLRSGSVNIINGMVGLNFSCDGTHYIPAEEFIENSMNYWIGNMSIA